MSSPRLINKARFAQWFHFQSQILKNATKSHPGLAFSQVRIRQSRGEGAAGRGAWLTRCPREEEM